MCVIEINLKNGMFFSGLSGYDGDAGFSADGGEDQEADQSEDGHCGHTDDHV